MDGIICSFTSKVHGANMGPIWGLQEPDGPHVDPMNFAIWGEVKDPRCWTAVWRSRVTGNLTEVQKERSQEFIEWYSESEHRYLK